MAEQTSIKKHLEQFLQAREPPKTFCPSEVARAMSSSELEAAGAEHWRDLMPRIRELAWEKRAHGQLQVLQKGNVIEQSVAPADVTGPIRLRRT